MRRSERHHLKENPLAIAIANLQLYFSQWSSGVALSLALILGTLLAYGGYTWWTERTASRAGTLLAEALVLADAPVIPVPNNASTIQSKPAMSLECFSQDSVSGTSTISTPSSSAMRWF